MSGIVIWMTGLPASGKSTMAALAQQQLLELGIATCILDGDVVRAALVPPLGYTSRARDNFYTILANLAAVLARQGLVVLVPATASRRDHRTHAREISPKFVEVYVATPIEDCATRDKKGLYDDAGAGRLRGVPGVGVDYEVPRDPDIVAEGGRDPAACEGIVAAAQKAIGDAKVAHSGGSGAT